MLGWLQRVGQAKCLRAGVVTFPQADASWNGLIVIPRKMVAAALEDDLAPHSYGCSAMLLPNASHPGLSSSDSHPHHPPSTSVPSECLWTKVLHIGSLNRWLRLHQIPLSLSGSNPAAFHSWLPCGGSFLRWLIWVGELGMGTSILAS